VSYKESYPCCGQNSDKVQVKRPLVRFLDGEGEVFPPDKERLVHPTCGATAGNQWGVNGFTEVEISHNDGKTWKFWGFVVNPYGDLWKYLQWEEGGKEGHHDLRSRLPGAAIKKARKFVEDYEARPA